MSNTSHHLPILPHLRVGLCQLAAHPGDRSGNLRHAEEAIETAAAMGTHIVLLPELWYGGYSLEDAQLHAAPLTAGPFEAMAAWAHTYQIYLFGSALERDPHSGRVFNTAALYAPTGELVGSYRKIHLFSLTGEDQVMAAGDTLCVVDRPWNRTAMAICYDLRFPEPFRICAQRGARIFLLCAAWPASRKEHWQTLLRARAIENQVVVAACNHAGTVHPLHLAGHSMLIDAAGKTVVEASDGEGVWIGEVALSDVEDTRAQIPVWRDRRPEIYHCE